MFTAFDLDCALHSRKRNASPLLPMKSMASASSAAGFFYLETRYGLIRIVDTGGGDRPVLLMVPDGPCFLEHFSELIELARSSWRVVVFDLPGFGRSFPENGYRHSFTEVCEILSLVYRELALRAATLAFSCANGYYALYFLRQNPDKVRQLILIQTPSVAAMEAWKALSIPWPVRQPYLGQLIVHLQRLNIPHIWFKTALPKHSPKLAEYGEKSCAEIKSGACNCLASVVQGLSLMREQDLTGIAPSVPVHLIWGSKDYSHRFTDANSLLQLVPQAKISVWDDVGHFANLEQPARFLKLCEQGL